VFSSVTPAWNNLNLDRLARKIVSPLIFGHVRAAYPGMPVSEQNCHPFQVGPFMFMHNGVVGGFSRIKRAVIGELGPAAFDSVQSFHSDSAVTFALFLHHLGIDAGDDSLSRERAPKELLAAMEATIETLLRIQREHGVGEELSLMNFVASDGRTVVATRFVWPESARASSLYYTEASEFRRADEQGPPRAGGGAPCGRGEDATAMESEYSVLRHGDKCSRMCIVASEPITASSLDWIPVPKNHALVVTKDANGIVDVTHYPLAGGEAQAPRRRDTLLCLDALAEANLAPSRAWLSRHPHLARGGHGPARRGGAAARRSGAGAPAGGRASLSRDIQALAPNRGRSSSALGESVPHERGAFMAAWHGGDAESVRSSRHSLEEEEERWTDPRGARGASAGEGPSVTMEEDATLEGHSKAVQCLALHGHRLFSSSMDCTIRVWDLASCTPDAVLRGHTLPVLTLIVEPAAGVLVSCAGRTVRTWSLGGLACLRIVSLDDPSSRSMVTSMCLGGRGELWVARADARVEKYMMDLGAGADAPGGPLDDGLSDNHADNQAPQVYTCSTTSETHLGAVMCVREARGLIASASTDSTVRLWRKDDLAPVKTLRGHRGAVLTLAVVGDLLLSGGRDNSIRVWDLEAMCCRRTLLGHENDVLHLSGVNGAAGAAAGGGGSDVLSRALSSSPDAGRAPGAAPSHDSWLFTSASADGTVRVWSARSWACLHVLCTDVANPQEQGMFLSAVVAPSAVVTASQDGNVRIFHSFGILKALASADREAAGEVPDAAGALSPAPAAAGLSAALAAASLAGGAAPPPLRRPTGDMRLWGAARDYRIQQVLRQFVQIRSVSPDPSHKEDCFVAAKFLSRLLEMELGAEVAMSNSRDPLTGEEHNHVVLGRLGNFNRRDVPTVCFYGHYDVQPGLWNEGWRHPPFDLTLVNGYLYGRGASDNKGPSLGFVYAVKDLLDSCESLDELPVNVVFIFEGEEEMGSRGFSAALQKYQHWMGNVSMVVVSNTFWVGERVPCVTVGMRGMINVSVEVSGPERDVHSGNEGGVFNEPMADLTKLLATLVDSQAHATVPGFYDDVSEVSLEEIEGEIEARGEFSVEEFRAAIGVPAITAGSTVAEVLHRRWCMPSLSISDVRINDAPLPAPDAPPAGALPAGARGGAPRGGAQYGPTRYSVVPRSATGHVSVRYVPGQKSNQLIGRLHRHLTHEFSKLRSANTVTMNVRSSGSWWERDAEDELVGMVDASLAEVWGQKPMHVREGGTMPVTSELENLLHAPAVLIPFGQASDSTHLPNERLRQVNLLRGRDVIRDLLTRVGRAAERGQLPDPSRRRFRPRGDLTTQSVMTLGKIRDSVDAEGALPDLAALAHGAPGAGAGARERAGGVALKYSFKAGCAGCAGDPGPH